MYGPTKEPPVNVFVLGALPSIEVPIWHPVFYFGNLCLFLAKRQHRLLQSGVGVEAAVKPTLRDGYVNHVVVCVRRSPDLVAKRKSSGEVEPGRSIG